MAVKKACSYTICGSLHRKSDVSCQDVSYSEATNDRCLAVCCDGHGARKHIRSRKGAEFGVQAVRRFFDCGDLGKTIHKPLSEIKRHIILRLLAMWDSFVEEDLLRFPFSKEELSGLSIEDRMELLNNPYIAYGTTLSAVFYVTGRYLTINIGDSSIFLMNRKNRLVKASYDENAGSLTDSMCQSDAFRHFEIHCFDASKYQFCFLATDGFLKGFSTLSNLEEGFARTLSEKICANKFRFSEIEEMMMKMVLTQENSDDASFAIIY